MAKKILISGGTGMVGANMQSSFSKHNLDGIFLGRGKNLEYDLTSQSKTRKLFNDIKPDVVIHLAANVGGIAYNKSNPGKLIRDNLQIGINVLDACKDHNVEFVYNVSTCCSYPALCPTPFKEDDIYNGPEEITNSPYGSAKKSIMKMGQGYRQQYGMKITTFIPANLYGYFDNFNLETSHVIPALIRKFLHAKENNLSQVFCWGDGGKSASRDFLFAEDLANIITKSVISQFDYPDPINLGTGEETYISDLAKTIAKLTNYEGEIVFTGEVSNGQPRRVLDTSRAKETLGWVAETKLEDGLIKTIEWVKNNELRQ